MYMKVNIQQINNVYLKSALMALAVAVGGFLLFGLTFIFDFFVQSLVRIPLSMFLEGDFEMNVAWVPIFQHFFFVFVIAVISYLIFRSKIAVLLKAIYMTVPTGVALATVGMELYQWPAAVYLVCTVLTGTVLYYFYKTKQPWIYYFSVLLTASVMLLMTITGVEI